VERRVNELESRAFICDVVKYEDYHTDRTNESGVLGKN